jgi:N-methylhydantoinase A/oxoprolinase/acetone carboxylase beta subunit
VPLQPDIADPLAALERDFRAMHDRIYGHSTDTPAAIVNLRSVHRAGGAAGDLYDAAGLRRQPDSRRPSRLIRVAGEPQPVSAAIYDRHAIPSRTVLMGPAIIEQDDTTALIEPGWRASMLENGTLLLERS